MDDSAPLEKICYSRNFLTDVIARVDFVSPVSTVATALPKALASKLQERFAIDEPKPLVTQEFQILPKARVNPPRIDSTEWNFFGSRREKRAVVSQNFLSVSYKEYRTYEVLKEEFSDILTSFFRSCPDAQPSRLGLRYVNQITGPLKNPLRWEKYVDRRLLSLFSFEIPGTEPVRVFHNLEVAHARFNLHFQFGVFNQDFPAPIRQPVFILDFDAYHKGLVAPDEVGELLDEFHAATQALFERCITPTLRKTLDAPG